MLLEQIKKLEKQYSVNSHIIQRALYNENLDDDDYLIDYIVINEHSDAIRNIYFDFETTVEDQVEKLEEYINNGENVAYFYLFMLHHNDNFDLKKILLKGYINKDPLATLLYSLYFWNNYLEHKKDVDFFKAQKIIEEAYNFGGRGIVKVAFDTMQILKNLEILKSKIGLPQPIKKQICINEQLRNIYLFTGKIIYQEQVSNNGLTEVIITIRDDYGNDKTYSHRNDSELLDNSKITIVSIDNISNDIGCVYNYNNKEFYDDTKINYTNLGLYINIFFVLFLFCFCSILVGAYTGIIEKKYFLLVAAIACLLGFITHKVLNIKNKENESIVKKIKNDIRILLKSNE